MVEQRPSKPKTTGSIPAARSTVLLYGDDMNPRIALAALAALSTLAVTPAEAGPTRAKNAQVGPAHDVAAVPAYPTAAMPGLANRAHGLASKRTRTAHRAARGQDASHGAPQAESGSGVVRSKKTGATARVAARHAAAFQAYIDDLEARGARVYYMGGIRPGPCWIGGLHPCGKALDVCQDSRDVVSRAKNCRLPGRAELARIAARHGLFEGGQWCNGDMGHVQAEDSRPCRGNLYSAVAKFKDRPL